MVRFVVLWRTPHEIEAFERHYREIHIPLTKKLLGLRRYTLARNPVPVRGGDPHYQVAALEWDDMKTLRAAFQSPEGQAIAADVDELARLAPGVQSAIYEVEEVV